MKSKIVTGIIAILLVLITLSACGPTEAGNEPTTTQTPGPTTTTTTVPDPTTDPAQDPTNDPGTPVSITGEEAQQLAYDFVVNAPTFAFDGMPETLVLVDTETFKCPGCWDFTYEFDCTQAGYGNRTGMMLAQVITPHRAVISIRNGVINAAVLDNSWDMQVQMMVATEAESRELAREYLETSPTFAWDGIEGSIVHVETLQTFGFYSWGFVFEFECASAGYGDRTDQQVATVITQHTAVITVQAGEVTGGTIDGYWDMETQQPVTEPTVSTATATATEPSS